jgi:uncharacterized membrane protein YjdF
MNGKKIIYATIAFCLIAIIFYGGTMGMNQLCIDDKGTYNPQWDQNSDLVCQLFTNMAQFFMQITKSI